MVATILWGRHPRYANGEWIKLARSNLHEYRARKEEGFELQARAPGEHPSEERVKKYKLLEIHPFLLAPGMPYCTGFGIVEITRIERFLNQTAVFYVDAYGREQYQSFHNSNWPQVAVPTKELP